MNEREIMALELLRTALISRTVEEPGDEVAKALLVWNQERLSAALVESK